MDNRIGKHGEFAPQVCAISGQVLRGRNYITYALPGGYYFRVAPDAQRHYDDALYQELAKAVTPERKLTAKKESEE